MHDRRVAARHWSTYVLVVACVGALVAAVLVVGPSTSASGTSERIVTVAQGVVQSTVSGSGSVAAAQQLDVNFATAGTLTHVYVKPGQRVAEGQLLAAIDPTDAQTTLDQAEASLAAAEAGGSGGSSGGSGSSASSASASTASDGTATATTAALTTPTTTTPATTPTTPAATTPATPAPTTTTPAAKPAPKRTAPSNTTAGGGSRSSSGSSSGGGSSGGSGGSSSGETAAQKAANVASAQAAVDKAETALAATELHAPIGGTVASVGAAVGEQVSGGGSSSASSSSSSSSGSGSGSGSGSSGSGSGSGSGASGAGSSAFIVLADLDAMNVVVPFSESDVGKLRVGQPATVSVNALPNEQLAAHVVSIATLPTSSSGVVSYDVTLRLDQLTPGLKAGMTASAEVVVERVGGALNVASAAISGRGANASVTLVQGAKRVRTPVVTGVVGDSTTQILGGLRAGDQVAIVTTLPSASTASSGLGASGAGVARAGGFGGGGGGRFGGGGGGGFAVGAAGGGGFGGGG